MHLMGEVTGTPISWSPTIVRLHKIDSCGAGRSQIHLYGLPGTSPVLNRNRRLSQCQQKFISWIGALEPEGKLVETQLQGLFKRSDSSSPITVQHKVEILRRASALSETQFHRNAALEIVAAKESLGSSPFEHAADCKERHPSPQSFLTDALIARDACEYFLQPAPEAVVAMSPIPALCRLGACPGGVDITVDTPLQTLCFGAVYETFAPGVRYRLADDADLAGGGQDIIHGSTNSGKG